jgi:hypothetical protein
MANQTLVGNQNREYSRVNSVRDILFGITNDGAKTGGIVSILQYGVLATQSFGRIFIIFGLVVGSPVEEKNQTVKAATQTISLTVSRFGK